MNSTSSNSNNSFILHFLKQIRKLLILLFFRKHLWESMSYSLINISLLQRTILKC